MARNEQPETALVRFRLAQARVPRTDPAYGLAAYDAAMAHFYRRAYSKSAGAFLDLLKSPLTGFDRRDAALWQRQASARAGYHARHASLGIPQVEPLDPECGIASLSHGLRALGLPHDRKTLLARCRVTGMGSTLTDLVAAAEKLGASAHTLTADEKGFRALPKPLVAHVERDHFVSVLRTDTSGVTYTCTSCGHWPGGPMRLTWKQWRAMDAGPYLVLAKKNSGLDRVLSAVSAQVEGRDKAAALRSAPQAGETRVAAGQLTGSLLQTGALSSLKSALAGHAFGYLNPSFPPACGGRPNATHPGPYGNTPMDAPYGNTFAGDPVNLATGEEQYEPATDISVYNPNGQPVGWRRIYNSLRGGDQTYQSYDWGIGWSHSYNSTIWDPAVRINPQILQGSYLGMFSAIAEGPPVGLQWDITHNGSTIATSAAPNGWGVTPSTTSVTVAPPVNAPVDTNYKVRFVGTFGARLGAWFDILPPAAAPRGVPVWIPRDGGVLPANNAQWDVVYNGVVIANSGLANGWVIGINVNTGALEVKPPVTAVVGTGYHVRVKTSFFGTHSAFFEVLPERYQLDTGTKYLIMPNGSRVAFSANAIPTASTPVVNCSVEPGAALRVDWHYDATNAFAYYILTFPNRAKWKLQSSPAWIDGQKGHTYVTTQIADRMGNGLLLEYGVVPQNARLPLLARIRDGFSGVTLLTIMRAPDYTITGVSDCYGRSVYYHCSNIGTLPQLDQVSQIVATTTPNPPIRFAYGYTSLNNGGTHTVGPFLHTITVPSPTGTGTSTATINYDPATCFVSSVVDANGNKRTYTSVGANLTKVTLSDALNNVAISYTSGYDANMNETTRTDGTNTNIVITRQYGDPNHPHRPSQVTDANGVSSQFTWDTFGNLLTMTSPRSTTCIYTWDYTAFPLGRLMSVQEGGKTPATYQYYEPSGLVQSVAGPTPDGSTGTVSFTYDSLGNILTTTRPGNNADPTITASYSYDQGNSILVGR